MSTKHARKPAAKKHATRKPTIKLSTDVNAAGSDLGGLFDAAGVPVDATHVKQLRTIATKLAAGHFKGSADASDPMIAAIVAMRTRYSDRTIAKAARAEADAAAAVLSGPDASGDTSDATGTDAMAAAGLTAADAAIVAGLFGSDGPDAFGEDANSYDGDDSDSDGSDDPFSDL